jgi:ERCC4-related helicase
MTRCSRKKRGKISILIKEKERAWFDVVCFSLTQEKKNRQEKTSSIEHIDYSLRQINDFPEF